jgi:methylmalonyl-CoA mutase
MGVNTFLSGDGSPTLIPGEVIRSTETEKQYQIDMLDQLHKLHEEKLEHLLEDLKHSALKNENLFNKIVEISKYCSIGQITKSLYDVGGQYRRNM